MCGFGKHMVNAFIYICIPCTNTIDQDITPSKATEKGPVSI